MFNQPLRKSYRSLLYIILTVLLLLFPSISFADADRIFKENSKAVVIVIAYDEKGNRISQGSGFIVREDGAIVTNYHVISNARNIKIKVGDKTVDVEGLIHIDKENDLVILKIKGENLPTVRLGDIEKASVGEKVYVISSPQGFENTISEGILSGIWEIVGTNKKILQITAPVSRAGQWQFKRGVIDKWIGEEALKRVTQNKRTYSKKQMKTIYSMEKI
ncbi:Trypsin-like peptidase domain-containing protein [Candidatus Kryptobacter tengchongensis]|nr:Trypsin-like peptidase domain-containing protein [Candidatus Kryptobacter tengchongensis]